MDSEPVGAKTLGAVTVILVNDNIADRKADVLVNAANNQLQMGGGVAAALRSRGGIEIHLEAIRHAPARIGSVVRTAAGQLAAKYVYHAVVIDYDVSKGTSAPDVGETVRNLVKQAAEDGVTSMAMPLFGAGVGGLSVETSLTTILDGLEDSAPSVSSLFGSRLSSGIRKNSSKHAESSTRTRAGRTGRRRRTDSPRKR